MSEESTAPAPQPVAWLYYDGDSLPTPETELYQSVLLSLQRRHGYANETPLYTHPLTEPQAVLPTCQQLTDADIREVFLANGFTIKPGCNDLKPYVFAAARALLALAAAPAAPASQPVAPAPTWMPVSAEDLEKAEAYLAKAHQGAAFGFVPADAYWLANITAHMIREVRATRAAAPAVQPAAPTLDQLREQAGALGYALVTIRPTRAMERVMMEDDWGWDELLAVAGAVTEEQYHQAGEWPAVQPAEAVAPADADLWRRMGQCAAELLPSILRGIADDLRQGLNTESPKFRHIFAATIDQAATALAATPPVQPVPEVPAWQPIETAPKDGRKLILFYRNSNGKARTVMAKWVTDDEAAETDADDVGLEGGWYECIDNWDDYCQVAIYEGEPTHWMPLPPAPKGDTHG